MLSSSIADFTSEELTDYNKDLNNYRLGIGKNISKSELFNLLLKNKGDV